MFKLTASFNTPSKKQKQTVEIILPELLFNLIKEKNYSLEIINLENDTHTVYVTKNNIDILSATFKPNNTDDIKYAFKRLYERLNIIEEIT